MPNRDGRGPKGKGPKTGMELGNCSGAKPRCSQRGCRKIENLKNKNA